MDELAQSSDRSGTKGVVMKQLQRISLAVLISSALTGGVFANGTADLVMDPADTWAPEKAAVNKMAVRLAESIEAQESEKTGIDLTAIGKSYTADSLEALSETCYECICSE